MSAVLDWIDPRLGPVGLTSAALVTALTVFGILRTILYLTTGGLLLPIAARGTVSLAVFAQPLPNPQPPGRDTGRDAGRRAGRGAAGPGSAAGSTGRVDPAVDPAPAPQPDPPVRLRSAAPEGTTPA